MSPRYVAGKVLGAILTLAFVLAFNFFLFRVVEDDPVNALYRGRNLTPTQKAELADRFGVDDPMPQQFANYVRETAQLNLGYSFKSARPVADEIRDSLWPTIWLVGVATLLSTVIGTWMGIRAGWRRGSATDTGTTSFGMITYAMPDFWLGMLLLGFFAVRLDLFPTGGMEDPGSTATGVAQILDYAKHMFLPCLTLTLAYIGEYQLVMRSALLDTVNEDYLSLARAKGLRDADVRRRHAVPNAMLPVVTLTAINFGFVLSGAIAVESIYSWPGLGRATLEAIRGPDFPMLQGLFLVFSAAVILANLVADLLYAALDPRVGKA